MIRTKDLVVFVRLLLLLVSLTGSFTVPRTTGRRSGRNQLGTLRLATSNPNQQEDADASATTATANAFSEPIPDNDDDSAAAAAAAAPAAADSMQALIDRTTRNVTQLLASKVQARQAERLQQQQQDAAKTDHDSTTAVQRNANMNRQPFDLATALFCAGLAFDVYVEPPANSSRWEYGSRGVKVAFVSTSFTRSLYQGLVQVIPQRCTGLPEQDSMMERVVSGAGVDACVMVAALEGTWWPQDVDMLEREQYHAGVLDLTGAAHVVRSSVAWATVDERKSRQTKQNTGKASPYHVPATWGSGGGQAIWPEEEPFYLYVQDPATVRLVFTVFDKDRVGEGTPVGSTWRRLVDLIPQAKLPADQILQHMKTDVLRQIAHGEIDVLEDRAKLQLGAKSWQGRLKLTSKPRKRDKNGQILTGAAAGAFLAGPMGAAAGAALGNWYEGQVQGSIHAQVQYLPIPQIDVPRKKYRVMGGMPGIDWGALFDAYRDMTGQTKTQRPATRYPLNAIDLEHCFYITHEHTGATCSVFRSLEQKLLVVSFRGTCAPIDLITDVNIVQEPWVEGDHANQMLPMVHAGFRSSLNSIARRLKELLLATVQPDDDIANYDVLVTGHSLGGALATLFTADLGQYGIDAGRALPMLQESEPWWKFIADSVMGQSARDKNSQTKRAPPRPKSLRLYSFGSPRVGNQAFADLFDAVHDEGWIDQSYRIVNGDDVVTRLPRSVNALITQMGYEHCGPTVLVSAPSNDTSTAGSDNVDSTPTLWIEGESDNNKCPVRDGLALNSPMADGSLLSELIDTTKASFFEGDGNHVISWDKISGVAAKLGQRFRTVTAADVASVLGIDRDFTEREFKIVQSVFQGNALFHHLEDSYFGVMKLAAQVSDDGVAPPINEDEVPTMTPMTGQADV